MEALGISLGSLIWYLVNFVILLFLLQRFLYRPVLTTLANRTARIQESIENAEQVKQQLARAQQDYDAQLAKARAEAATIVAQANDRAKVQADQVIAQARAEAERIQQEARQQIAQERDQLLRGLQTQLATLVTQTASSVIGKELRSGGHEQLINESISSLGRL